MKKEYWLVFSYNGKELCSYTIRGTFEGEKENTIELLAYENGINPEDILTTIVLR